MSGQIAGRIRLIFCVIFCFLQVSILSLVILLRILEAHSLKGHRQLESSEMRVSLEIHI